MYVRMYVYIYIYIYIERERYTHTVLFAVVYILLRPEAPAPGGSRMEPSASILYNRL